VKLLSTFFFLLLLVRQAGAAGATEHYWVLNGNSVTNLGNKSGGPYPRWRIALYNPSDVEVSDYSTTIAPGVRGPTGYPSTSSPIQGSSLETGYRVRVWIQNDSGSSYYAWTNHLCQENDQLTFTVVTEPAACSTRYVTLRNPSTRLYAVATWRYNGIVGIVDGGSNPITLYPGESQTRSYCINAGDRFEGTIYYVGSELVPDPDGGFVVVNSNLFGGGVLTNGSGDYTTNFWTGVGQNESPYPYLTNSAVNYGGLTESNIMAAGFNRLSEGLETLEDRLNKLLDQGSSLSMSGVESRLDTANYRLLSATNSLAGISNSSFEANLRLGVVTNQLDSMGTNLSLAARALTNINFLMTNGPGLSWTNPYSADWVAAETAGGLGEITDFGSGVTGASEPGPSSIGSSMQVELPGGWGVVDFNPLNNASLAQIFDICRKLFGVMIVMGYVFMILKDISRVVTDTGYSNQLTVPNLDIATFNIGILIIPIILFAFMLAWGVLLAVLANLATAAISSEALGVINESPFATASGSILIGIELARNFFPFTLFFGCFTAYVIWRVSAEAARGLFMAVVRFIVG